MWNARYWATRFWNGRYWAKVGVTVTDTPPIANIDLMVVTTSDGELFVVVTKDSTLSVTTATNFELKVV